LGIQKGFKVLKEGTKFFIKISKKKNNKKDYQKDYESHSSFKKKKSKLLLFRDRLIDLLFRDKLIERYKSSETKKENDSINLHEIILESPIEKNMNDRISTIRNHIERITKSETKNDCRNKCNKNNKTSSNPKRFESLKKIWQILKGRYIQLILMRKLYVFIRFFT
jgi:hypothetical protein